MGSESYEYLQGPLSLIIAPRNTDQTAFRPQHFFYGFDLSMLD
jgi:hypothetical protein